MLINKGNLYLMVGIPGVGKSTYLREHLGSDDLWISRDNIRFHFLKEGDNYFSHETEVYKEMVRQIKQGLINGFDVYVDATHLNPASRNKLKYHINSYLYKHIYAIYIKKTLQEAIQQNNNRKGTRAFVPPSAIRRMATNLIEPTIEEGFDKIYIIENNKIQIISKEE